MKISYLLTFTVTTFIANCNGMNLAPVPVYATPPAGAAPIAIPGLKEARLAAAAKKAARLIQASPVGPVIMPQLIGDVPINNQ